MDKYFATIFVLASLLGSSAAVKVELFDSTGFRGPYLTSRNGEGCVNLTTQNFMQEGRSLKTDACIMIFKAVNCTSHSIRVDPGEYSDLAQVKHEGVNFVNPQSFRVCTSAEGGIPVNVDIYGNAISLDDSIAPFSGLLMSYRDVCSCMNLPNKNQYIGNVTRIHNFGNCIKIYTQPNCSGDGVKLLGGVSPESLNLSPINSFIIPSTSIGLCDHRPSCFKLNHTVFQFDLNADQMKVDLMSRSSDLAITSKTVFRNNGTATQTQTYEAKKIIREVIEVSRVTSFSVTNTYSTVRSVTTTGSFGFLFWRTQTVTTLSEAYTRSETTNETNSEKYVSDESREIVVRQQIEIPPCSEYQIDSYITMVQNYPVDYTVWMYVGGWANGNKLTADEVKERLTDGLAFEENYDNFTVIASGVGTVVADFSMEAVIDGEGGPLEECSVDNGRGP